ncbi:hypothetical protein BDW69DRAFT_94604 [Aspergillus filifer]
MDKPGNCKEIELLPHTINLIRNLGDWTTNAKFTISKEESWELCSDTERETVLRDLLDQPDIKDKTNLPAATLFEYLALFLAIMLAFKGQRMSIPYESIRIRNPIYLARTSR